MKTASELIEELANNSDYQARKRKQDQDFARLAKIYAEDEKEMLEELADIGFDVSSVWDFVNSENNYLSAVPTLIRHLEQDHHYRVLGGIARSLAINELSYDEELWDILIERYKSIPSDKDIDVPSQRGAQESLGIAIAALTNKNRVEAVISLINDYPDSDGVFWFKEAVRKYAN